MTSAPLLTVLMTVYNGGAYLKRSIESVLAQTFRDYEFLVINDCSQDDSARTISVFPDCRIRLVNNETNLGQTRSLNKGLSLARGRYIARIDADDLAFPQWLEKNLSSIQAEPRTAVISCKAVVIDGHDRARKILNTPLSYDEMVLRSLTATPVNHVGSLYRTDVINSVGGYDENFKIAADYELWSRLIRKGIRLASHDEVLVAIRVHERSISIMERGRADMAEISEIIGRNFEALSSIVLSEEQKLQVWKLWYATGELTDEEFFAGLDILRKGYEQLKPGYKIPSAVLQTFIRARKRTLYMKRAFADIEDNKMAPLRKLAEDFGRSEGWGNMFSLLWLGSWAGPPVLKTLPRIYERLNVWSTRQQLRQQPHPEFIH